jgi:hypothetical protein
MKIRCKVLGRVWGVPSLLGFFLEFSDVGKMNFHSVYIARGVPSIFSSVEQMTCGPGWRGQPGDTVLRTGSSTIS